MNREFYSDAYFYMLRMTVEGSKTARFVFRQVPEELSN